MLELGSAMFQKCVLAHLILPVKVVLTLVLGSSSGTYVEKNISEDLAAIVERLNHAKRCPLFIKC